MIISYKQFGATYNSGSYGGQAYNATGSSISTDGSTLPATGNNMVIGVVGGVLLIVIAIVLFVTMRRNKRRK